MAFEGNGLVLGEVEEVDFAVCASEKDIGVELIDVDDVGVLVGMELGLELVAPLLLAVLVLEEESVGVAAVEMVFEGLYFVEGGQISVAKGLGVGVFQGFGQCKDRLLLMHLYRAQSPLQRA